MDTAAGSPTRVGGGRSASS